MKILYFGMHDPSYSRNNILISGLRQNGVEVIECSDRTPGIRKFINLYRCHRKIQYDVMIVGFMGHAIVPFAKLISRKPVIFDAFLSMYDSNVFDRKLAGHFSIKALYYWILDWMSFHIADKVLFDTNAHINYASATFHVWRKKFERIWIGAQNSIFYPRIAEKSNDKFVVFFHGKFIPLQGIEYILQSAKILENERVEFWIIGDGQEKKKMDHLVRTLGLANVKMLGFMKQEQVVQKMAEADVCLGIFGDTQKTQRVIPNKVYECLAVKKPVITADTPAIRELFSENDLILVGSADAKGLSQAILHAKNNPSVSKMLAEHGYKTVMDNAIPIILGKQLKTISELAHQAHYTRRV